MSDTARIRIHMSADEVARLDEIRGEGTSRSATSGCGVRVLTRAGPLRQPGGFELPRRLRLGRIFLVVAPSVSGLAILYVPDAEFAGQLDQDPDDGQNVEGGEDLQRLMGQRQVRVGDARRGQRAGTCA